MIRLYIAMAVALLTLGSFWAGTYKGGEWADIRHQAAAAQAEAAARELEQKRAAQAQKELDDARNEAKAREDRLRRDAAGARAALERLRDAIAANTGPPSPGPEVAPGTTAGTAELFGACARSIVQLAEDADAQLAECKTIVRGLQGWVRAATGP